MEDVKVKVFISYARKDKKLRDKFLIHLTPLKSANLITWHDSEISPGEDWDEEIKKNIEESDLIIFLLSPDLIASKYINENELKLSIKKHLKNEAYIVPVILRKCNYKHTYFNNLQGLPEGFIPIKSKEHKFIDAAFCEVTNGLERVIEKIIKNKKNKEHNNKSIGIITTKKTNYFSSLYSFLKRKITAKYVDITSIFLETELTSRIVTLENLNQELAKELHDNILGRLFGIRLNIDNNLTSNEKEKINPYIMDLKIMEQEIREICHEMSRRKDKLNLGFNLESSLLQLEKNYIESSTIDFNFNIENLSEYHNSVIEVNCYRIVQELINNVIQHSNANKCDVVAKYQDKKLFLNVKDDGIGFDINKRNYNRKGISNIIERVEHHNGTIKIDSKPKKGSEISITF